MAIYRFYRVEPNGKTLGGSYFEALDDLEAVVSLRLRFEPKDCILWCDGREIATVAGCRKGPESAPGSKPLPPLRNL